MEKRTHEQGTGEKFWRSLNELMEAPDFEEQLAREFPRHAQPLSDFVSRRQFLKLMGASMALAGLSACGYKPQGPIISQSKTPPEHLPGETLYFATALAVSGFATGVLAKSYEGRPIKIEGNPNHPASLGATSAITQAMLLDLYDPDRSQNLLKFGRVAGWSTFTGELLQQIAIQNAKQGAGVRILTGAITSPTLADQIQQFLKANPQAKWYQYEAVSWENVYEGTKLAFGEWLYPLYRLDQVDVLVALDSDILYSGPGAVRYAHDFMQGRKVRKGQERMNRLFVAEPMFTVTGMTADERLPIPSSKIGRLAYEIARLLDAPVQAEVAGELTPEEQKWAQVVAGELKAHAGRSLLVVGEAQPPAVHAIAHAINHALGNIGNTVVFIAPPEAKPTLHTQDIRQLAQEIQNGAVEVLIMLGVNPAYDAPADLNFAELIPKVPFSVHLGAYVDETAALCVWHVPETHPLETWGDVRAFDGTVSIQQPLIYPLYSNTRTALELMALINGQAGKQTYELVQAYWQKASGLSGAQFDKFWRQSVHDGVMPRTARPVKTVALKQNPLVVQVPALLDTVQAADMLEIRFAPDPTIYDGRFANNAWLQELPKPVTRTCWDNLAFMSLNTFKKLGLWSKATYAWNEDVSFVRDQVPLIEIRLDGKSLVVAAYPIPGHVDDAITLHLGYGRTRAGAKGSGAGFNAYTLRTTSNLWFARGAEVIPTRQSYTVARTEEHHLIDTRQKDPELDSTAHRPILLTGTLEEFRQDPELKNKPHRKGYEHVHPSMYPERFRYDRYENPDNFRYAWGMVIDPTLCTGCSACVTACQAENNIPVVGKEQVVRRREMLWLRIDRYFKGSPENPKVYQAPVPCMHCENAGCELVCPVAATVHDHEGLNVMIYNRCVGTRYCSNNCPYKVRRFNYYRYSYMKSPVLHLMQNPDVTVRGRGVMEKCTYCVQRISKARINAKRENRRIRDGEVIPACQQACPTGAIVFGDLNDPNSKVRQLRDQPHNFAMLGELNYRPRTTYLAKIDNPHPELSGAEASHAGSH
ncbi:MAG: molybdopterin oxidoreductase [Fimbriimonadales bacterium]|nr:MAG: molybdopterin oxidoreductase [Fimbriimonadales bacterium]